MADSGHWMQGAVKHPGYLHRATGTPAGKDIPQGKIDKAEHSKNPHLAAAARLAERFEESRPAGHHPGHEGSTHHKAGSPDASHVAEALRAPHK